MDKTKNTEGGFSVVELLATIIIGSLFVLAFYQMYVTTTQSNATAKWHATANDLAYSNLRKYTGRPSFTCDNTSTSTTNLITNPNAPGQVLSTSTTASPAQLPGPLVETIRIYAPRGCDPAYPAKIDSIVEYGSPVKKIIHSTYVN